jgi:multidrug efflux pump
MALIFIPVMGGLFGKGGTEDEKEKSDLAQAEYGDVLTLKGLTGVYVRFLDRAIRRPLLIIVSMIGLLAGVQWYYATHGNGVEFFPDIEPDFATVLIHARGNLSVYEQDALVREVEAKIFEVEGIDLVYTQSGGQNRQGSEDVAADVIGQITLELAPWQERPKADAVLDEVRKKTSGIKGILVETRKQQGGPPTGKAVQIELSSREPEALNAMVGTVRAALEELGDFRDIEDSRPLPGIEWELVVDRTQAAKFGVDLGLIGDYVRMVTNGLKIAEYRPNDTDDEVDMVIRYPANARTLDRLDRIRIVTSEGPVPISNFVKRVPKQAVGTIDRVDQRRSVSVKADLAPEINTAEKVEQVKSWIEKNKEKLDPRVRVQFKGEDADQREAQDFLGKAFIGAMFLIAIILLTQFNSVYSTFLILSAVIMSTIGVFIGLIVTGQTFGIIMTGVGIISLAGVIVSNNIVLIDTFDQFYKREGKPLVESILRTGALRLRPVFLTQITTVLGLLPMMFQMNIDFMAREISYGAPSTQWWVQLSTAIVFGITFATTLTLVFTPCALMLRHKWRDYKWSWLSQKFRRG